MAILTTQQAFDLLKKDLKKTNIKIDDFINSFLHLIIRKSGITVPNFSSNISFNIGALINVADTSDANVYELLIKCTTQAPVSQGLSFSFIILGVDVGLSQREKVILNNKTFKFDNVAVSKTAQGVPDEFVGYITLSLTYVKATDELTITITVDYLHNGVVSSNSSLKIHKHQGIQEIPLVGTKIDNTTIMKNSNGELTGAYIKDGNGTSHYGGVTIKSDGSALGTNYGTLYVDSVTGNAVDIEIKLANQSGLEFSNNGFLRAAPDTQKGLKIDSTSGKLQTKVDGTTVDYDTTGALTVIGGGGGGGALRIGTCSVTKNNITGGTTNWKNHQFTMRFIQEAMNSKEINVSTFLFSFVLNGDYNNGDTFTMQFREIHINPVFLNWIQSMQNNGIFFVQLYDINTGDLVCTGELTFKEDPGNPIGGVNYELVTLSGLSATQGIPDGTNLGIQVRNGFKFNDQKGTGGGGGTALQTFEEQSYLVAQPSTPLPNKIDLASRSSRIEIKGLITKNTSTSLEVIFRKLVITVVTGWFLPDEPDVSFSQITLKLDDVTLTSHPILAKMCELMHECDAVFQHDGNYMLDTLASCHLSFLKDPQTDEYLLSIFTDGMNIQPNNTYFFANTQNDGIPIIGNNIYGKALNRDMKVLNADDDYSSNTVLMSYSDGDWFKIEMTQPQFDVNGYTDPWNGGTLTIKNGMVFALIEGEDVAFDFGSNNGFEVQLKAALLQYKIKPIAMPGVQNNIEKLKLRVGSNEVVFDQRYNINDNYEDANKIDYKLIQNSYRPYEPQRFVYATEMPLSKWYKNVVDDPNYNPDDKHTIKEAFTQVQKDTNTHLPIRTIVGSCISPDHDLVREVNTGNPVPDSRIFSVRRFDIIRAEVQGGNANYFYATESKNITAGAIRNGLLAMELLETNGLTPTSTMVVDCALVADPNTISFNVSQADMLYVKNMPGVTQDSTALFNIQNNDYDTTPLTYPDIERFLNRQVYIAALDDGIKINTMDLKFYDDNKYYLTSNCIMIADDNAASYNCSKQTNSIRPEANQSVLILPKSTFMYNTNYKLEVSGIDQWQQSKRMKQADNTEADIVIDLNRYGLRTIVIKGCGGFTITASSNGGGYWSNNAVATIANVSGNMTFLKISASYKDTDGHTHVLGSDQVWIRYNGANYDVIFNTDPQTSWNIDAQSVMIYMEAIEGI